MIKHEITSTKNSQVELKVELTADYLEDVKKTVVSRMKSGVKVAGFRPGKAPDNIVERHLDQSQLQSEVLEAAVARSYTDAVIAEKLETIASPKVELKKFVPYTELEYTASAAIMPKIEFDPAKLKVKQEVAKVDAKEIDETIEGLRKQMSSEKPSKDPAKDGDKVKVDFEGSREGKPVEGAAAQNSEIILGEGRFIPGFEENIIGLKEGDEKEFEVIFPKDYHAKDLAGAKVNFKVKLNEVNSIELPVVDDEFAKAIGDFKNVTEMRSDIEAKIKVQKSDQAAQDYEQKVMAEVLRQVKFEVAPLLLDEQKHRLQHEVEENLKQSGLDVDKYLAVSGKAKDEFEKELHEESEKRVKTGLLIRHIVDTNRLEVTDDEIEAELQKLRTQYTDKHMLEEMTHGHFRDDLAQHLLATKARQLLVQYALGK
jgi:trigger factor